MPSSKRSYESNGGNGSKSIKRKRSTYKPTGVTTTVTKKIKAAVKRSLTAMAEKKRFVLYAANQTIRTGAGAVLPFTAFISPEISQGGGDGQRIGNKVKVVKQNINLMVNLLPYNATTNPLPAPVWIRVLLLGSRKINTNNIASTDIATNLFNVTSGTVALQGTPLDLCFSINPESWHVYHDEVFKLGVTSATSTGPTSTGAYLDNSDMSRALSINVKNIGTHLYQDTSPVPTNKNTYLVIQAVSADGQAGGSYFMAECHFAVDTTFIDV